MTDLEKKRQTPMIAEIMIRCSDEELIDALPYIRNEDGIRMSLIELRHCLRETIDSAAGDTIILLKDQVCCRNCVHGGCRTYRKTDGSIYRIECLLSPKRNRTWHDPDWYCGDAVKAGCRISETKQ